MKLKDRNKIFIVFLSLTQFVNNIYCWDQKTQKQRPNRNKWIYVLRQFEQMFVRREAPALQDSNKLSCIKRKFLLSANVLAGFYFPDEENY